MDEYEKIVAKIESAIRSALLEYDAETYHGRSVNIDELAKETRAKIMDAVLEYEG